MNPNVIRYPKQVIHKALASFKTPFFLYEESQIRHNCRKLQRSFKKYFENFTPLYAIKANTNPHIIKIIIDEGFGLDCSSPSEVWLTNKLDTFAMHTGNYSSTEEIAEVLASKKILLNLDDISMLNMFETLEVPEFLSFRINPGITGSTQKSLMVAGENAKYGVMWEQALDAYKKAKKLGVQRFGIHMMTGSNILNEEYFSQITRKLLVLANKIHQELKIEFEYINIGGGFGVPYKLEENTLSFEKIACDLRAVFDEFLEKYCAPEPKLMVEPGRIIVADTGFLVTSVTGIKESYKKFIGVDAGMNDLPRQSIYNVYHHISVLGENIDDTKETVNVVGRLCENNDQFAQSRQLPVLNINDVLIIHNAGGHAYAMGHNYNGRPRSDEYLLEENGKLKHIRRAETIEDLYQTIL